MTSLQTKDVNLQTSTQARKAAIARTAETIQSTRVAVERTAREWRAGAVSLRAKHSVNHCAQRGHLEQMAKV